MFFNLSLKAQEVKRISIVLNTVYEPVVSKYIYTGFNISLNDALVPRFSYIDEVEIKGSIKEFSLDIVRSKKLLKPEIEKIIAINDLPTSVNKTFTTVQAREKRYAKLELNPIYRNGNDIFQVESVEYSFKLNKDSNVRFSKTNKNKETQSSILSSGKWYKIGVDRTGVFKIDSDFLKSIGINNSDVNPKKIRLFGNGGAILPELLSISRKEDLEENSIWVSGENDGKFDDEDFILFYAKGPVSWEYETRESISHKQNIYSDLAYYFINVDSAIDGKRIENKPIISSPVSKVVTTFTDYKVHEKDLMNYIKIGKRWFGEDFSVNNSQNFQFNFENIDRNQNVVVKSEFSAKSNISTSYSFRYNNKEILNKSVERTINSGKIKAYVAAAGQVAFKPTEDNLNINIVCNTVDPSVLAHLDYIEVIADRELIATDKQFGVLNFESKKRNEVLEYVIKQDANIDFVWDVTDFTNVQRIIDKDNSSVFKFREITDGEINKYHVVNLSDTFSPIKLDVSMVENQNLHSLENVQYLIITPKDFKFHAERLANYHRINTRVSDTDSPFLNVEVIDVEKIYNEFGSGSPDITAIRDFIKYVYDRASSEQTKLKYVCFLGDATFDYKGTIYTNKNTIPVYLHEEGVNLTSSYSTDDYYGYLDVSDNVSDQEVNFRSLLDVSLGRIPVKSKAEAKNFVDKTLNYYSLKSSGKWKTKVTFLGDDGADGLDQRLIEYLENSAIEIEGGLNSLGKLIEPQNLNVNIEKLYSDAFKETVTSGGGSYPEIKRKFLNSFNQGALVINYFGHGNTFALANENFLDISDIRNIRNIRNLPLFITVTCDFSKFDDPTIVTAGEELITSPFGGAGSMITTSREITISNGNALNLEISKLLYQSNNTRSIAEVLKDAKNNSRVYGQRFVYFFGDPAMKLSLPKEGVVTTAIHRVSIDPVTEKEKLEEVTVLNGLSRIRVSGVVKNDGVINKDFNGSLFVTLFDKEIERKTLLNEGSGRVVRFKSLENKVFVGEAIVKSGVFSFDFVLPKDVSTVPGKGKFSYYAVSNKEESIGSDFKYSVGSIDTSVPKDNTPPVIQLFIGDETFVNGGATTSTPILLAKIQDDSGINTSLNSIGHNITLVIDDDLSNPISLNEFYTTEKDDFTKGIVRYDIPELSLGSHTLTIKAWDSHNNSSIQTLNLFVEEDNGFYIKNVLNYPNPFINYTEFWFKNNRRGQPLEIKAQIYTVSGKLVKTIGLITSDNSDEIQRSMNWDGRDDFGNKLGKGVYLYKLIIKETISGETAEKTEKLVIL